MSIDTIRETIDEIQEIKWLIDDGPAHPKLTEAQTRLTNIKSTLSTYGDEIRRECAENARNAIFDFGIGDKEHIYSPIIRKDLAAQLVERAIIGKE